MRLHHWQGTANFGDLLNLWLWPKLLPRPIEACFSRETLFCGIGTVLNDKLPSDVSEVRVFGSGLGYGRPPRVTDDWHFYCVRGPLTAAALGLDPDVAVTDSAMLVREVLPDAPMPAHGDVGFMPHHTTARSAAWRDICASESIRYLDPADDVERIIDQIRGCRLVIAEAMHGAILADTFRVPWIAVRSSPQFFELKWDDWTQSLDVEHRIEPLPVVHSTGRRRLVAAHQARRRLRALVRRGDATLSSDRSWARCRERLLGRLEILRRDVIGGS